ncbi:MAG: hypothetical protein JWO94_2589 [Verrucomicrobiaceae bacterium]|nr:hypothetical protein [Verrucomicrobiaceae bacterium]
MINPFREINWQPDAGDLHKFARSLIIGFPCLALIFFLGRWGKDYAVPYAHGFLLLGGIGAAVGLVCLAVPWLARPLYFVWYALAASIGIIMANLLFCVMFYALFTPLGLLMRLTGRDALKLKRNKAPSSYWQDAEPPAPAEHYFSQY